MSKYTTLPALAATLLLGCSDPVTQSDTDTDGSTSDPSTGAPTTGTPSTSEGTSTSTTDETSTGAADETSTGAADETSTGAADETSTGAADETSTGASSSSTGEPLVGDIEVSIAGEALGEGETRVLPGTPGVGMQGPPLTVTVANVGEGVLNLGGIAVSGLDASHFSLDVADDMAAIDAGGSITFDVRFLPTTGGIKRLPVEIASDDPDEDPFSFTLGGHTDPNRYRPIATTGSPSARFNTAIAATEDDRVVLFGGRDASARLDDTWILDVEAETWTQLAPLASPPPRDAHEMVYLGDDTILMYGGNDVTGGSAVGLADTWIFDLGDESWTELMTPGPGSRFQHMMVATEGGAVLFGGRSGPTHFQDTWLFDGLTQTWSAAGAAGPLPQERIAAAMAFDGDDLVVLYGGFLDNTPLADTFEYTVSTNTWAPASASGPAGARGVLEGVFLDAGRMLAFSGKLNTCCDDPDPGTFAYDTVLDGWVEVTPPAEPAPRFNYGMVAIPGRNKAIIFGGNLLNANPGSATDVTIEYVGPQPM